MIKSIYFKENAVYILDQTLLPAQEKYIQIINYRQMIEAINMLRIRGAPAIGIAGAAGAYLASKNHPEDNFFACLAEIEAARPTAVNLSHACHKIRKLTYKSGDRTKTIKEFTHQLMAYEQEAAQKMGLNGAKLIGTSKPLHILTHCNTGSLATYGAGTALAVVRELAKHVHVKVYADETRPLLQGARLTMWELAKSNIKACLLADNAAASLISQGKIDFIITGADRIAANGDAANKIGTLSLAILAKHYNIPLYIVAPASTIDASLEDGKNIPIEYRNSAEVSNFHGIPTSLADCECYNPAFDITPASLITAIITDFDVYKYPYRLTNES